MERDGETPKKVVESSNKCFICSSIPTSKNKVYIFGKTSTDLAGIIRSSLEFNVKKYQEDSSLFVCRQCFQQLTKYERAAKKLREIKQELLTAFRNREQVREKRLARDQNNNDPETIKNGSIYTGDGSSVEKDHPSSINQCRSKGRGRGGPCPPSFFLKSKNRPV